MPYRNPEGGQWDYPSQSPRLVQLRRENFGRGRSSGHAVLDGRQANRALQMKREIERGRRAAPGAQPRRDRSYDTSGFGALDLHQRHRAAGVRADIQQGRRSGPGGQHRGRGSTGRG